MLKPEHSAFKVLVYIVVYTSFDLIFGIPLTGFNGLEMFGIIALATAALAPAILIGEHYTRKWWEVSER
jgi:hypothetical protein